MGGKPPVFLRSPRLSDPGGRWRLRRAGAALLALFFLGTFISPSQYRPAPLQRAATILFEPVPLDTGGARTRLGPLLYLGGWRLSSDNPRFGGISAMHVDAGRVIALTDAGTLIRFPLPRGTSTVSGTIDPLPDAPGSEAVKSDRDTESMTVAAGRAWIGFERRNAVWRYDPETWRSDARARPEAMRRWPKNSGAEGLVRLGDGRFLVFSEGAPGAGGASQVLLFDGDPAIAGTKAMVLGYRAPEGYRLTDAALLPDGRLLLLNRRFALFEGFSARLVVADVPPAQAGAIIEGEEIAAFRGSVTADNMEALSVTREAGRTMVWLASDDNFNPIQRTLLLKFALIPPQHGEGDRASRGGGGGGQHTVPGSTPSR